MRDQVQLGCFAHSMLGLRADALELAFLFDVAPAEDFSLSLLGLGLVMFIIY